MSTALNLAWSSVGRKILMAVTGLGLFMFIVIHLMGNLLLLVGARAFNGYAHFLEHLAHGAFIYVAEAGMIAFFLIHAASGIKVWLQKRKARETGYEVVGDAGGASKKSWASRTMIISGPVILLFVVLHVLHFKFGPGEAQGYTTTIYGEEVRDLYTLVIEEFNRIPVVAGYVVVMVLLGFHLTHGFWSGLQSLGLTAERNLSCLTTLSLVFGVVLAIGFIYIPVHIYLFIEPGSAATATAHLTTGSF